MPNRLAGATSPYLLQHADNPVDWWEWSDAAFEEAARRDVPVLLSVGYAACHWCHVMAHESFEDDATAEQVNAGFVAVKVDREERPDIDAVYMAATQAMTGQGGWPMTCFLTPAGEPFHCGTYYPTVHFRRLLAAVTQAWTDDGARVRSSAGQIAARLADNAAAALPPAGSTRRRWTAAVQALAGEFDAGERRVRRRAEVPAVDDAGVPAAPPRAHRVGAGAALATATAGRMARGGMYDQLAGGFARYSVDARWVVPHFEKMLYDNALLLRVYAHLARIAGPAAAARPAGGGGDRGVPAAGPAHARGRVRLGAGRRHGRRRGSDLRLDARRADGGPRRRRTVLGRAAARGDAGGDVRARLVDPAAARGPRRSGALAADPLRAARRAEPAPAARPGRQGRHGVERDGGRSRSPRRAPRWAGRSWVAAADATADLLLERHVVDGRVRRSSRDGAVGAAAGVLEDHAFLAEALLALHQATGGGASAGAGRRGARPDPGPLRRPGRPRARSSTPRTTPRRCCTGPGRSPTTPRRAVRRPSRARC